MIYIAACFFLMLTISPLIVKGVDRSIGAIVNIALAVIIFALISLNRQNQDFQAYVALFEYPDEYAEFGYIFLIKLLKMMGFVSHVSVLVVLSGLVFFTILNVFNYSKGVFGFLIFYMVFLLPLDVIQVRNTFCVFFAINALLFLAKRSYFFAGVFLLMGASYHFMGSMYALLIIVGFILTCVDGQKKNIIIFSGIFVYFIFGGILNSSYIYEIRTLQHYITDGKWSSLIVWCGIVLSYILLINFVRKNARVKLGNSSVGADNNFAKLLITIIAASLIFSAGLYYIYEFNRLYRFVLLLMIVHAGVVVKDMSELSRMILLSYFIIVFFGLSIVYDHQLNFTYVIFGELFY